jgi:lysophospholipase L1-like esterase
MIRDIDVLAREWADRHVAADHELAHLLGSPAPWERIVVLGDSAAAGVRDPTPGYRDLSWSDRLAAGLTLARPGAVLVNLGRRGLTAAEVREGQLDAALALAPDLAIVIAGGNDLLLGDFHPNKVRDELTAILAPLRATGADTLTLDLLDTGTMGDGLARLAALTREASTALGGWHAPLREHPAARDADLFAADGLHLNARGHAIVATALARYLGEVRRG